MLRKRNGRTELLPNKKHSNIIKEKKNLDGRRLLFGEYLQN